MDGTADSCTMESNITWAEFTSWVADKMNVWRKELNLAYKFSSQPQKALPCILNNTEHLKTLFSQAAKDMATHQKSKAKSKKLFQVLLIDHNPKKKSAGAKRVI
jgi:hypothetical protein